MSLGEEMLFFLLCSVSRGRLDIIRELSFCKGTFCAALYGSERRVHFCAVFCGWFTLVFLCILA